ncbi:MAG TPA: hypothetical protein VM204_07240, partial [Gaiellaceae bacterium]|nr:hypothetical protein [Gaiellaceae bacterium]
MRLRQYRDDDFDAVLELANAHQLAAFGEADYTAEDFRTWLTTPYVVVADDIRLLEEDGRLVGYADVDEQRQEPPRWWCDVKVAPDADAHAVIAELLAWIEERVQRGRIRTWTSASDDRVAGAYAALDFEPVRHSYRMEIDLAGAAGEPSWPEGVTVRGVEAGEERRVFEHVVEVWQDASDPIDETYEEWAHWMVDAPSHRRDLWFVAEQDGELAGFSLGRED